MTQANIMPSATPVQQDPLVVLQMELQAQRDRLRRAKDKLTAEDPRHDIYTELDGTVLSFMVAISAELLKVRDFLYGQIVEEVGALDERLDELEEPTTQLTAEDASDFSDLCDGAELLAKESTWKDKKKKDDYLALIAKCRQTIEDNVMSEGEDEEEEEAEQVIGGDEEPSS